MTNQRAHFASVISLLRLGGGGGGGGGMGGASDHFVIFST